MAERHNTMMTPPIEDLLDRVDSKFTLVTLGSLRAREINSYVNQLGQGLGRSVPPQVTSVAHKPLTIAFEEIAADKIVGHKLDPEELAAREAAEAEAAAAILAPAPEPVEDGGDDTPAG